MKSLEKLKKATAKKLKKQEQEATSSRYNKLSSILARLGGDEDPLSLDELGPTKDPFKRLKLK